MNFVFLIDCHVNFGHSIVLRRFCSRSRAREKNAAKIQKKRKRGDDVKLNKLPRWADEKSKQNPRTEQRKWKEWIRDTDPEYYIILFRVVVLLLFGSCRFYFILNKWCTVVVTFFIIVFGANLSTAPGPMRAPHTTFMHTFICTSIYYTRQEVYAYGILDCMELSRWTNGRIQIPPPAHRIAWQPNEWATNRKNCVAAATAKTRAAAAGMNKSWPDNQ